MATEIGRSNHGKVKLFYEGFTYIFDKVSKDNNKKFWRCVKKNDGCLGRIHTTWDNTFQKQVRNHNHGADVAAFAVTKIRAKVRRRSDDTVEAPVQILNNAPTNTHPITKPLTIISKEARKSQLKPYPLNIGCKTEIINNSCVNKNEQDNREEEWFDVSNTNTSSDEDSNQSHHTSLEYTPTKTSDISLINISHCLSGVKESKKDYDDTHENMKNYGFNTLKRRKYKEIIEPLFEKHLKQRKSIPSVKKGGSLLIPKNKLLTDKPVEYVYQNKPHELIARLRILWASKMAGNTAVNGEIQSIIEELREEGIIY